MSAAERAFFGLLGGTFDPIHHGHLRLAIEVAEALELDHVRLVPSADPPHRAQVFAQAERRFEMAALACDRAGRLVADDSELRRAGPSYTVDTLARFRERQPEASIVFIVGDDAFAQLPSWHRYEALTDYAHIVVVNRPGVTVPQHEALAGWVDGRIVDDVAILRSRPAGGIFFLLMPVLDIASSDIRERCRTGRSIEYLTPLPVVELIERLALYRD